MRGTGNLAGSRAHGIEGGLPNLGGGKSFQFPVRLRWIEGNEKHSVTTGSEKEVGNGSFRANEKIEQAEEQGGINRVKKRGGGKGGLRSSASRIVHFDD